MNKKEKEALDILRVPSFKSTRIMNKYIKNQKLVGKILRDSSISAKEFVDAMNRVSNFGKIKWPENEKFIG